MTDNKKSTINKLVVGTNNPWLADALIGEDTSKNLYVIDEGHIEHLTANRIDISGVEIKANVFGPFDISNNTVIIKDKYSLSIEGHSRSLVL